MFPSQQREAILPENAYFPAFKLPTGQRLSSIPARKQATLGLAEDPDLELVVPVKGSLGVILDSLCSVAAAHSTTEECLIITSSHDLPYHAKYPKYQSTRTQAG